MAQPKKQIALSLIDLVSGFVQKVAPWLAAVWLVVAVREAAISMGDDESFLGAWIKLTSNLRVSRGFAFVFGIFGTVYGLKQRSLRQTQFLQLSQRISELETSLKRT